MVRRRPLLALVAVFLVLHVGMAYVGIAASAEQIGRPDRVSVRRTAQAAPGPAAARVVDFNGDGYEDAAISSWLEDVGSATDAGAVEVLYGSVSGLQARQPDDQLWSQGSDGVRDMAETGDQFGFDLIIADFDGDGYSDLAIGVPFEDVGSGGATVADAGAVEVLYGSPDGLQAQRPDDQLWTQGSGGVEDMPEPDDAFGRSLAAADLNGDGYADLSVGVRKEDVGDIQDAGALEVLYGGPAGLQTVAPADQYWTQDSPGVRDQAEQGDWFARSLEAADFNGDGYADLAAGAYLEDVTTVHDAGAVNVLYGSSTGLQSLSPDDQFWTQDSPGVPDQVEDGDFFGREFGAGDFDGDGYVDLAIGARHEDVQGVKEAGAVNVLYGSGQGLQADTPPAQLWLQGQDGLADQPEPGDQFGYNLGTGDFNADGFDDLAMGAHYEDVGSAEDAGSLAMIYGGGGGGLQAVSPPSRYFTQDSPGVKDQVEPGDLFGSYPGIGDFNADGYLDLAISAPLESFGTIATAGSVHVFYSTAGGVQVDQPDDQLWTQDSPDVRDSMETDDEFGFRVN